jgi:hypothetical protein
MGIAIDAQDRRIAEYSNYVNGWIGVSLFFSMKIGLYNLDRNSPSTTMTPL